MFCTSADRPVGGSLKEADSECRTERRESRLSSKRSSEDRHTSRDEQQRLLGAAIVEYPSVQSYTSTPGFSPPAEYADKKTYDGEDSVVVHLNTMCHCSPFLLRHKPEETKIHTHTNSQGKVTHPIKLILYRTIMHIFKNHNKHEGVLKFLYLQ